MKASKGCVASCSQILLILVLLVVSTTVPVRASEDSKWYILGDKVEVEALKDEYVPFKTIGDIPARPRLSIELGDPFLDTGNLSPGFEVPLLGAVWQPRLWVYSIQRTALQTFDNGAAGRQRESELAFRWDLYANLQLTGTEKIVLGLRPLDGNQPDKFSRYTFEGAEEGWHNNLNTNVQTLFFEGDLGSLFPKFDRAGTKKLDWGFTVGRQPITFQEGILINDTIDALGFVRNNIVAHGTSNLRISGMWGWNRVDRNDPERGNESDLFALFTAIDAPVRTYNLDLIYVDDNSNGDGAYLGISSIQRVRGWGGISTAFRINSSFALEDEVPGNVIGDGTLVTLEISKTPHGSDDIVYFNPFAAFGNFTQAGREAIVGGPLSNTGILFASPNLSLYGAEINPFTDDNYGFSVGYQAFWDHKRRNLILELSTKQSTIDNANESTAIGFQLQQALGRHFQLQIEGFKTYNSKQDDGSGFRIEILTVY